MAVITISQLRKHEEPIECTSYRTSDTNSRSGTYGIKCRLVVGKTKNKTRSQRAANEVTIPVWTVMVINLATTEWISMNADLVSARKSWNATE